MAVWKPGKTTPTPTNRGPKLPKKPGPMVDSLNATPAGKPKKPKAGAKKPKKAAPSAAVPKAPGAWYDPSNTAARDASIASMLSDPLKPATGQDAVSFARSLAQSGIAPLLQDYDRQAGLAQTGAAAQAARTTAGTDQLRQTIAGQLASQQASQGAARERIAGVGAQLQGTIDQGAAQAGQAAAQDAATRGGGLDGGSAAQRAQEAANAKARGQAGTAVALDQQAATAQSGDQLLNQISAATAQQGGERQGAITSALNSQLRDVNEGRSKTLASGEQSFLKAIMDLQSQNIQTNLATETLGLNKAKASADTAIKTAQLEQQAKIASLNAKIKVTEGAEQRALRRQLQQATDRQRALDRAARTETADKNRSSSEKRAATTAAAKAEKDKASGTKLTPQDKGRRSFISNVQVAQASGQLGNIKKQAKNASEFRKLVSEKIPGTDPFTRQLLADLAYGGLRPPTINAYRAKYGRNPPAGWARYKAAAAKPTGVANDAASSIADALRGVGK